MTAQVTGLDSHLVATPTLPTASEKITLLVRDPQHPYVTEVRATLQTYGYSVDTCQWKRDKLPSTSGRDIVSLLGVTEPFPYQMNETEFDELKALFTQLQGSGLLWVTGAAQVNCTDPRYAISLGLLRTIRTEGVAEVGTLELESFDRGGWEAIASVWPLFQRRNVSHAHAEVKSPTEWVYAQQQIQIPRLRWFSVNHELANDSTWSTCPRVLECEKHGLLSTLGWKPSQLGIVQGTLVHIRTHKVGLNFKDVLLATGVLQLDIPLGCELVGTIEEVGPDVKHFRPGDRVAVHVPGALKTVHTIDEKLCVKIPDDMSFEQAATMPLVFTTAIHSLVDKAQLTEGQVRVLLSG